MQHLHICQYVVCFGQDKSCTKLLIVGEGFAISAYSPIIKLSAMSEAQQINIGEC